MKWLILLSFCLCMNDEIIVFGNDNNDQKWYITNDTVMGGLSNSTIQVDKTGKAFFKGKVSTDNNGGFAMTRLPVDVKFDDKKSKIILKVKGDGKEYQFRIKAKNNQRFWYVQTFQTTTKTTEIELPLADFYAAFRGYKLNEDNFSASKITEIAILIGNKKNEAFNLEIEKIAIK